MSQSRHAGKRSLSQHFDDTSGDAFEGNVSVQPLASLTYLFPLWLVLRHILESWCITHRTILIINYHITTSTVGTTIAVLQALPAAPTGHVDDEVYRQLCRHSPHHPGATASRASSLSKYVVSKYVVYLQSQNALLHKPILQKIQYFTLLIIQIIQIRNNNLCVLTIAYIPRTRIELGKRAFVVSSPSLEQFTKVAAQRTQTWTFQNGIQDSSI